MSIALRMRVTNMSLCASLAILCSGMPALAAVEAGEVLEVETVQSDSDADADAGESEAIDAYETMAEIERDRTAPLPNIEYEYPHDIRSRHVNVAAYVETIAQYDDLEKNASGATITGEPIIDIRTQIDISIHARLTPTVHMYAEFNANDIDGFKEVQEAYVHWDFADSWWLVGGRFHQWIGWERFDAPDIWRINPNYTFYNAGNLTGTELGYYWSDNILSSFFVVNEAISPLVASSQKDGNDLAYGLTTQYQDARQTYALDIQYDVHTTASFTDDSKRGDVWTVSYNGEIHYINDSRWSLAYDLAYGQNPNGDQQFVFLQSRYLVNERSGNFMSLSMNYLNEGYNADAIAQAAIEKVTLFDNQRLEFAAAMFWFPEHDDRFRLGIELRTIDSSVANEDEWGIFVQALVIAR